MIKGLLEFDMLAYAVPAEFYIPRYDLQRDDSFEDDRTTLYWNPGVKLNEYGIFESGFYSSDKSGKYLLIFEGISNDGQIITGSREFLVD